MITARVVCNEEVPVSGAIDARVAPGAPVQRAISAFHLRGGHEEHREGGNAVSPHSSMHQQPPPSLFLSLSLSFSFFLPPVRASSPTLSR